LNENREARREQFCINLQEVNVITSVSTPALERYLNNLPRRGVNGALSSSCVRPLVVYGYHCLVGNASNWQD
jgi:hypothetical protein